MPFSVCFVSPCENAVPLSWWLGGGAPAVPSSVSSVLDAVPLPWRGEGRPFDVPFFVLLRG